jgi:multiple sugar transport system permease protein
MISASLKPEAQVFIYPPRWVPNPILWENYWRALTTIQYPLYARNTMIITTSSMLGQMLSASIVAYGFARLKARGKDFLFLVLMSTLMLPYQVTLVPTYLLFRKLGWLNTYLPLIVPGWLGGGAFNIFLLRQFYATLPLELDDAAKIDGCSMFGIYWRIMLPLSKPALATVAIFAFFAHWSDFLGPLIYLSRPETYTLSLGLQFYTSAFGKVEWNLIMAGTLVSIVPPMLVFFLFQKTFVQGIALTGLKG